MIWKKQIASILLFSCIGFGSQAQIIDKIIAKVDDEIILRSDLEAAYLKLYYEGQLEGLDERSAKCQILERFIIDKMMLAKAEIDSVIVEDRLVQSQLDRRMALMLQQVGDPARLEEQYGKTIGDLKNELRDQIRDQMTIQRMEQEISQSVPQPTPKEVKRFYNDIPKDSVPYFSTEVEIAQIVKVPEISRSQKKLVRDKLETIKQRALSGEDFSKLAREYSEDYGSAKEGGKLGWLKRGSSVPEFEAVIFRTKPGELSRIVESQFGFHLIKLIDRRGDEYNAAHILIRPDFSDVDVQAAKEFLDSLRTEVMGDSLVSFENLAREHSDDKFTSDNGGVISSPTTGGAQIFVDDLDSYLYFTIDTMKVGTISPPLPYRLDDGRNALRIIYYRTKTPSHKADINQDYEKLYNMTLNFKRNQAINDWFIKTKDELYIYLDREYNYCNILGVQ